MVELLPSRKEVEVDSRGQKGRLPLLFAVEPADEAVRPVEGTRAVTKLLHRDRFDRTTLQLAVEQGHKTVVRMLLEPERIDVHGQNMLK
ncbi:MAG: hypothetical protein M1816_003802 [Peltula sp. TS41687]|nr:MAG: hypothetical protein M1816_003802 [Peltula sp. TS41687]